MCLLSVFAADNDGHVDGLCEVVPISNWTVNLTYLRTLNLTANNKFLRCITVFCL